MMIVKIMNVPPSQLIRRKSIQKTSRDISMLDSQYPPKRRRALKAALSSRNQQWQAKPRRQSFSIKGTGTKSLGASILPIARF